MTYYCSNTGCRRRWKNFRAQHPRRSADVVRCRLCQRPATPLKELPAGASVYVKPDFPEHFNWSMGCVVKNRKHHERLQRERGLQDWQPVKESPGFSKLRKEGFRI